MHVQESGFHGHPLDMANTMYGECFAPDFFSATFEHFHLILVIFSSSESSVSSLSPSPSVLTGPLRVSWEELGRITESLRKLSE